MDWLEVNRAHWDERAPAHAASFGYAVEKFSSDPDYLSEVVRFDLPLLGDVAGVRGVHLQCHIGTDTVSLARLGARMTGLDFSPASIAVARSVAEVSGVTVDFVESDVLEAAKVLPLGSFGLVFTGIGALCWLPDIGRWADVVVALLSPGGRLFLREGHPIMWAVDERRADGLVVRYPYFELVEPLVFDVPGTYVDSDRVFEHNITHSWNHGVGEIVTALLGRGLRLTRFVEHDSVPWKCFDHGMVVDERGEWQLADGRERLPLSYTLEATKPW